MDEGNQLTTKLSVWHLHSSGGEEGSWALRPLQLELGARLGEGGSAQVFAATLSDGRTFALKRARPGYADVLLREAKVLTLAAGPNVPRLEAVVVSSEGEVGLLLERLEGLRLSDLPLSERNVAGLAERVWASMSAVVARLHDFGFVHGDIRPENVLVSAERVVLIDFGLSTESALHQKALGYSPHYAAPELLQGKESTPLTDAFALAKTVVESFPLLGLDLSPWLEPRVERRARLRPSYPAPEALLLALLRVRLTLLEQEAERLAVLLRGDVARLNLGSSGGIVFNSLRPVLERLLEAHLIRQLAVEPSALAALGGAGFGLEVHEANTPAFEPLSLAERARFLGFLLGPSALSFPLSFNDEELWQRALSAAQSKPLSALTVADLNGSPAPGRSGGRSGLGEVELALLVGSGQADRDLLEKMSRRSDLNTSLLLEAAHLARRRDEAVLGHRLLDQAAASSSCSASLLTPASIPADSEGPGEPAVASASASVWAARIAVERALLLRRQGRAEEGLSLLEKLAEPAASGSEQAWVEQALAYRARFALDRGDLERALAIASEAPSALACREVLALINIAQGKPLLALEQMEQNGPPPTDDEGRARKYGVLAMAHQAAGALARAEACYQRAIDSAMEAHAVLEEATYLTGLAAVASDGLNYETALLAAERASALFEVLGRPAQAARALLAQAAVFSGLGLESELKELVYRGVALAERGSDQRCVGYFSLCLVDGLSDISERKQALERARSLLLSTDDQLRVSARELELLGQRSPYEALVQASELVDVRIEWWKARALAYRVWGIGEPAEIVAEVLRLCSVGPSIALGPAAVIAAELALDLGQVESARRLLSRASELAERVLGGLPSRYRERGLSVPWMNQALARKVRSVSEAQLGDVEVLLRALSHRDGLKPLFRQFLDLLLIWTGVERGILFLKAPGGRLVPRLGRNLRRTDLSAEQQKVSETFARRALDEGRAVTLIEGASEATDLNQSVHFLKLKSVLAVPLAAGGESFGVAYLDDKVRRGAFGEAELAWASLIASTAGLAIRDARDRLLLRRATRRAERMSARLEATLVGREASLEVLERQLRDGEPALPRGADFGIVYESRVMHQLLGSARKVAASEVPLLVVGESGSGKELIARAVHQAGRRAKLPFVAENCAALPESLLESELFGHVRGAFTGATRDRAGLFEMAHGGTLLLDEVGEMSLPMQAKLLRVLQDGVIRKVGSEKERKVDVRLIAATHRSLMDLVRQGKFREDLLYRLEVVTLTVPPLRERREDILPLVRYFLGRYAKDRVVKISPGAAKGLVDFEWPGNVRQLENEVRRLLVFVDREIHASDLSLGPRGGTSPIHAGETLREKLDALEKSLVVAALDEYHGNRTRVAESLGLSRHGLLKMMKRLGLNDAGRNLDGSADLG